MAGPMRRTGRPPLDANSPSVNVTVRVPATRYDALYAQAQRERSTVSDVVRRSSRLLSPAKLDTDPNSDE